MPSIIVVADTDGGHAPALQLKERVSAPLLRDAHFSAQLIERIAWALADAEEAERGRRRRSARRNPIRPPLAVDHRGGEVSDVPGPFA